MAHSGSGGARFVRHSFKISGGRTKETYRVPLDAFIIYRATHFFPAPGEPLDGMVRIQFEVFYDCCVKFHKESTCWTLKIHFHQCIELNPWRNRPEQSQICDTPAVTTLVIATAQANRNGEIRIGTFSIMPQTGTTGKEPDLGDLTSFQ
jgi:hypothetical protein